MLKATAPPRQPKARSQQTVVPKCPKTTELLGLQLELQPEQDAILYPQYATALHAWFLKQVQVSNPDLSAFMHDEQAEKCFTLSRLQGPLINGTQGIGVKTSDTYHVSISAFSKPVIEWMAQWVKTLPDHIPIRDTSLIIQNCSVELPPMTYTKLWRGAKTTPETVTLHFISPTSFRSRGHHLPLPMPRNLLQSYLRRWNTFAKRTFEMEPFLAWVDQFVVLLRHQLSSIKTVAGKRGSVTGFIGTVELGLTPKSQRETEYGQLFACLGQYAPYCGTGHKTTFGLGVTRLGWSDHWHDQIPPMADQLLGNRIATLTEVYKSQRKRQGKDRASNAAALWATVMARRELGDSLREIATDLDITYESAKTYSKLARKALQDG